MAPIVLYIETVTPFLFKNDSLLSSALKSAERKKETPNHTLHRSDTLM